MEYFKSFAALAITFGLLGSTLWLLKRGGHIDRPTRSFWRREAKARHLCFLERLTLSPDCSLHLIEVDEYPMLIAVSSKGVVPIPLPENRRPLSQAAGGVR